MRFGNTLSNIANNGLAAINNEDIYFVNVYRGEDLYRVCGKMYSQITEDKVRGINIIGDTIYYTTLLSELKSININGENKKVILEGLVENVIVCEDYIFYINVLDNYSIYRYNIKNNEIQKISSDICDKINISNDNIYYIKCSDNLDWYGSGSICEIDKSGQESRILLDTNANCIIYDNGYIFFTSEEFSYKLCRMNILTREIQEISKDSVGSFNIVDSVVYYSNLSDEGKLYKLRLDDMIATKISDDMPEDINIVGEYIYFANAAYGYPYRLYRMKLNGEEKQMI
ncbi:MAG: DUF5050 domain-containing protein [Clostridium sp.]